MCDSAEILPLIFIAGGSPLSILELDPGGPSLRNGLCKCQGFERVSLDRPCERSKGYAVCSAWGTYCQDA